jgi:hypothetical protein
MLYESGCQAETVVGHRGGWLQTGERWLPAEHTARGGTAALLALLRAVMGMLVRRSTGARSFIRTALRSIWTLVDVI